MSPTKLVCLIYKDVPIQSLTFNSGYRKNVIIDMWKHMYGKSFSKATIKVTKTQ